MNTAVKRLIRKKGRVTGVELECGAILKMPSHGRVVLAAGTSGSARLLMRSGIEPRDEIELVAGSALNGETMIGESEWIGLPVGENLMDHLNTNVVAEHPDIVHYNHTQAW